MSVNKYIGARYVPLILGDWTNAVTYEPLSVVLWQGDSYTSRCNVPVGIDITDDRFWVLSGNYNAQIASYLVDLNKLKKDIDVKMGDIISSDTLFDTSVQIDNNTYSNANNIFVTALDFILGNDSSIKNLNLNGKNNGTIKIKNNTVRHLLEGCKIKNSQDSCVYINSLDASIIKILNNYIDCDGAYPLVMTNAVGSDLALIGNTILTKTGDGIEINNPNETFYDTRIIGNSVTGGTLGTSPINGFGIGLASPIHTTIVGNVVNKCRQEGVHLEGKNLNTIIADNVFNTGMDGYKNQTQNGSTYLIVTNNHFKKNGSVDGKGLWSIFNSDGTEKSADYSSNRVDGYNIGVFLDGNYYSDGAFNLSGCKIDNCTYGLKTSKNTSGNIVFDNVDNPLVFDSPVTVDSISVLSKFNVDKLISTTFAFGLASIKHIFLNLGVNPTPINVNTNVPMLKLPKFFEGVVKIKCCNSINFSLHTDVAFKIKFEDSTFTSTKVADSVNGAYTVTINDSNGYLNVGVTTNNLGYANATISVDFDGIYIFDSSINVTPPDVAPAPEPTPPTPEPTPPTPEPTPPAPDDTPTTTVPSDPPDNFYPDVPPNKDGSLTMPDGSHRPPKDHYFGENVENLPTDKYGHFINDTCWVDEYGYHYPSLDGGLTLHPMLGRPVYKHDTWGSAKFQHFLNDSCGFGVGKLAKHYGLECVHQHYDGDGCKQLKYYTGAHVCDSTCVYVTPTKPKITRFDPDADVSVFNTSGGYYDGDIYVVKNYFDDADVSEIHTRHCRTSPVNGRRVNGSPNQRP